MTDTRANPTGADMESGYAEWVLHDRFFELYDRMFGEPHIADVLREVAAVVCEILKAERATIYLVDHDTMELESVALIGNVARVIRVPIRKDSLSGFCALTRRDFVVADAYGDLSRISPDLRFDSSWDEINGFRTRDVMNCPVTFKDELLGVVQVINSKSAPFSEVDLIPLRSISRTVGYSLYHAKLYDDLATMKQVEKEKAGFMRIMVHELKSPVAAAKMMTDVLAEFYKDDAQISKMTGRIGARLEQMTEMVSDMLGLARVKEGGALGDVGVLDITEELARQCQAYREHAEMKGLQLIAQLPDTAVPVRFDSKGLQLVLSNLLSNAVKYTPAGDVTVTLDTRDHHAVLRVADSGIGIPKEDIPKLFREFFRASNAKRSRIQGTGVGLAGVKHMVERFGGELSLESRENEGSTFSVRLPLHDA